ncbi:hypothetical protein TorRG33x02_314530 [Trema orientale]|uniref:Uncharacterized protein n=1 Tax=Trema orientale TaxID=63057 RepID=A0A2P5BNM6_TREOI|nr:hypothetical protein TorRG33x02_314530 [Trema orientale]
MKSNGSICAQLGPIELKRNLTGSRYTLMSSNKVFSESFDVESYELDWLYMCPTGSGRAQMKLNWVQLYSDQVQSGFSEYFSIDSYKLKGLYVCPTRSGRAQMKLE